MAASRCAGLSAALRLSSRFRERQRSQDGTIAAALGIGAASMAATFYAARGHPAHCEAPPAPDRLKAWQAKWEAGNLGWHLDTVHPTLQRFLDELLPDSEEPHAVGMGPRVVFPLCGKSVDMAWLCREGYRVVGIEGVRQAIDDFAGEHGVMGHSVAINLPPGIDSGLFRAHAVLMGAGDGEATRAEPPPPVLFIQGDFLKLTAEDVKTLVPFDAAFDRGGLVAVTPESRPLYASVLTELLVPGGRVLLVTVEHDAFAGGSLGPPFEVTEAEVRKLFGQNFDVRPLQRENRLDIEPVWRQRGCSRFDECAYLLTKRASLGKS